MKLPATCQILFTRATTRRNNQKRKETRERLPTFSKARKTNDSLQRQRHRLAYDEMFVHARRRRTALCRRDARSFMSDGLIRGCNTCPCLVIYEHAARPKQRDLRVVIHGGGMKIVPRECKEIFPEKCSRNGAANFPRRVLGFRDNYFRSLRSVLIDSAS